MVGLLHPYPFSALPPEIYPVAPRLDTNYYKSSSLRSLTNLYEFVLIREV